MEINNQTISLAGIVIVGAAGCIAVVKGNTVIAGTALGIVGGYLTNGITNSSITKAISAALNNTSSNSDVQSEVQDAVNNTEQATTQVATDVPPVSDTEDTQTQSTSNLAAEDIEAIANAVAPKIAALLNLTQSVPNNQNNQGGA